MVPDDKIFVHKMEGMDVDEIVQLNRVLLAGTPNNTLVGRPFVQGVQVLAAVEEQVRDATTYIYKRKRASGYRRFRGFRAVFFPDSINLAATVCLRMSPVPNPVKK